MERLLRALPPRPQPAAIRLGATAMIVAASFIILLGLHAEVGIYWLSVLYPAIMAAAIVFDRGSGFVAAGLSAALLYLTLKDPGSLRIGADEAAAIGLFTIIAAALAGISEGLRVGWERAVAAEKIKDLLLRELGHRIKNNLAMAISVLSLQARSESSAEASGALADAALRIQAIADAHDHLDPMDAEARVEMPDYLAKLCGHLREHLGGVRPVRIDVTAEPAVLRAEDAIAVGLIVNELVTNAFKHAFPGERAGAVRVAFAAGPPFALTVEDDGIGCPPGRSDGLGSKLLHLLVRQVGGTIVWEDREPGCRVCVTATRSVAGRLAPAPVAPATRVTG